jgi:hypothetical protein
MRGHHLWMGATVVTEHLSSYARRRQAAWKVERLMGENQRGRAWGDSVVGDDGEPLDVDLALGEFSRLVLEDGYGHHRSQLSTHARET